MSVAENFLLESGLFYFCKISGLFLKTRYSYLCWPLFFMKQSLTNSFNFEKSCVECRIHDICFVWWACFSIHSWHFLWVPTVLLFSPICSFIHMGQTSCKGFSIKMKGSQHDPLISRSAI
jgi:hypothetical protein